MYLVEVDDSGRIALPQRIVAELEKPGLRVDSWSGTHIFLGVQGDNAPVFNVTLGDIGIPDVLSFFNMFRKTGVLHLDLEDGVRRLFFKDGEIIFATSNRLEDDLGEVLCEMGKLGRKELQAARAGMDSSLNLSQRLVKERLVAARDLWLATRQQVESIVYALFTSETGSCYFIPKDPEQDNIVRLSMSTQNLIMEGLRRVDEKALYWRRLRSPDALLSYTGRAPNDLDSEEKQMMRNLYSADESVRRQMSNSGLSEYDALRVLYQLVDKGMLEVTQSDAQAQPVPAELESILELFNEMLALLYEEISPHCLEMREEVNRFIRELAHPHIYVFRGVRVSAAGTMEMDVLANNLSGLEVAEQKRLLVEALTEIVYMECSIARRVLSTDAGAEMVRRVQDFTARARKLLE